MSHKKYVVLILLLVVCILLQIFHPGGIMAFYYPSILWGTLALTTLRLSGPERIKKWFNKQIFLIAALISVFQIFIILDAGLILGFGQTPMSYGPTTLAVNAILVLSTLFGLELSRAYIMKTFSKKRPVLTLGTVTLLYAFINTSVLGLLTFDSPLSLSEYLGTGLLPSITENLLACYLALLGGPAASLAYRGPLQVFQRFSPIFPDLSWGFEALIGVLVPILAFISVTPLLTPTIQRKIGLSAEKKKFRRSTKAKKTSIRGWTIVSVLCVLIVWASTGLLGFYPTVVASGSMRPTMDVGDLAIVVKTPIDEIKTGDIVQYVYEGEMNVHRVYDIQKSEGETLFITKGDDNPVPDTDPVFPAQIKGKLIFTIPKLGWISIYTKTAIASIWSFFSANTILAYVMLTTITSVASIYAIHAYKNRSHRYWQRNRGWLRK